VNSSVSIRKRMRDWQDINRIDERFEFCCGEGEYLFHDPLERDDFNNERDFFSLND